MNVKLLNVKYSPNVGDGLLVECLEGHLRTADGMTAVSSVDLAGRTAYGASAHHRETMVRVLNAMPAAIRPSVARAGLSAKLALGLRNHYRRELAGAHAVVVSGGNLLSDLDLNFPMKIAAALGEAARLEARIAVYGCGVASAWSQTGQEMICGALRANPPVWVAVRDSASKAAWTSTFRKRRTPRLRSFTTRACSPPRSIHSMRRSMRRRGPWLPSGSCARSRSAITLQRPSGSGPGPVVSGLVR